MAKKYPTESDKPDYSGFKGIGQWLRDKGAGGPTSGRMRGPWGSSARANEGGVRGTVRNTGAGYTGAKGNEPAAPAKSAKMAATIKPKMAPVSAVRRAPKAAAPAPAKKNDDYFNRRAELGSFYLNATSGMFSPKAGGSKKKK